MKRILFFLSFLPYLAAAQVAKDTVTVLTIADIPAGAILDTTNFTFVQDNAFKKATFDSLYKYTRVKLLAASAITSAELANALSGETGTGAAVFATSPMLTTPNLGTPSAATLTNATGLPIATGLTGLGGANHIPYATSATALTTSAGLTFDGTNFATTGTASATKFIPTDTSATGNGMYLPATNTLGFSTNDVERMRITSTGNVGIGTTNPAVKLHIVGGGEPLRIESTNATGGNYVQYKNASGDLGYIGWGSTGSDQMTILQGKNADLAFFTNSAEHMRITSGGNVGIGETVPAYKLDVNGDVRADTYYYDVGSALVSSSDANFKKNVLPLPSMLQKINSLEPIEFEWNDLKLDQMQGRDNLHKMLGKNIGLIAQDVYNVFPEFTGEDAEGNMTVSYISLIVPMLKAIQEQQQQIEQLKQRITQLENK